MPIKLNVPSSKGRKLKNSYAGGFNKNKPLLSTITLGGQVRTFFKIFSFTAVFCIVLFSLGFGIIQLYKLAVTTPYFNTEYIEVSGNARIAKDEILLAAGIELGVNSLSVNIGQVERSILLNPWVELVSVKRVLPRGFAIKVKERVPSFWMHSQGQLNYSDAFGRIIAPVDGVNFVSLPTLNVQTGSEDILSNLGAFIKDIKIGALPIEFASVSNVNVNRAKGVELYIEDRQMYLSIAVNDWVGNLKRLAITLNDVTRRNELDNVKEIYAANGNVWVIKKDKSSFK